MQTLDSIQGFRPKYYEDGRSWDSRVVPILVHTSATLAIGTAGKRVQAGGVAASDAVSDVVSVYIVGFLTRNRIPVALVASNTTLVDGTYTEATTGDTYAASSDNLTDKKIVALCVPAEGLVVSGKLDAAAGTTTGSNLTNYYIDIENTAGNYATLLDESTATTAVSNYITIPVRGNEASCIDPQAPATADRRVLVKAAELQDVGNAVAIGA